MPIEEKDLKTILDDLEYLIKARQEASLKNMLLSLRSEDIAQLINNIKDNASRLYVFKLLDTESASEVIMELDDVVREQLVDHLEMRELAELVDEMDSDDAADFVSELDEEVVDEVLENVEEEDREEVRQLLEHEEDTAGGIMALEIIAVNQNWTVDQVIQEIRRKADEVDDVYNVYVVDDEGTLVGFVTVKDLIIASGDTIVSKIMDRDVFSVPVTMDQEQVAHYAKKYDLVSVPVVDENNRLLGRITIDDIVDVMVEEATEDIQKMAGLSDDEDLRQTSVFRIVRGRLPWLITGLMGGIFAAFVMASYEQSLRMEMTLLFFVPVVLGMGGNVGIQSSAIVVRGLATGEISGKDIFRRLAKEMKVSLINGLFLGLIIFAVVTLGFKEPSAKVGFLIGSALISVMLMAGIVGSTVPLVLKKINIDPALATGPFITTSNDIIGLYIYLAMATFFLKAL